MPKKYYGYDTWRKYKENTSKVDENDIEEYLTSLNNQRAMKDTFSTPKTNRDPRD